MGKEFPVKVRLSAVDKLTAPLDKIINAFPGFDRAVKKSSQAMRIFNKETEKLQKDYTAIGGKMKSIGAAFTLGITAPVVAGAALSAKAFMDFETALIGVGKTTNLDKDNGLTELGDRFRKLAKEIPVPVTELLKMGQVAAQLGVKGSDDLLKFTSTMAKLEKATNIAGEEGAISLARFMGNVKADMNEVDRFGSAIVDLGNNFRLQESQLLHFATRLSTSMAMFKPAGHEVLGMAAALESMGIGAELGSSAILRSMSAVGESIGKGGKEMEALSRLTGIASKDLKKSFDTDATGVFRKFVNGLNSMNLSSIETEKALKAFGIEGVGNISTMSSLTQNVELFNKAMDKSKEAFDANNALEKEFGSFMKSRENQLQLTKQRFFDLAITVGEKLAPAIDMAMKLFIGVADFLSANPWALDLGIHIAGITALIGPLLLGLGGILAFLPQIGAALGVIGITGGAGLAAMVTTVGILAAKFAIFAAAVAATHAAFSFIAEKTGLDKSGEWLQGKIGPSDDELMTQGAASVQAGIAKRRSGLEATAVVNKEFSQRTNNARVDINVRAPQSTSVIGESSGGILSINRGAAGAF